MNRWLLASIAVLVVLLACFWFTSTERGVPHGEAPVVPAALPVLKAPEALEPAAAPPSANPEPELVAPEHAPAARESKTGVSADELSRAVWVEGRVLFPDGTPLDEEATVEARGKKFEDGSRQRVKVNGDGSFRVAFAEHSKSGWLALTARYAYLSKPYRWKKDDPAAVLLTPELGGRIAGHLRLPEGTQEDPGGQVTCYPVRAQGDVSFVIMDGPLTAKLERNLEFGFDGLPPGGARLHYEGGSFLAKDATTKVERGATSTIELELSRGASLAGRVVDANGAPLAGVQVGVSSSSENRLNERSAMSATDGSFLIRAVSPPKVQLKGSLAGHVSVRLEVDGLREGEERAGLELVFGAGTTISGRVTWPDGKPARAEVRIVPDKQDAALSSADYLDGPVQTGEDGAFSLTGLEPGIYSVRASGHKEGEKSSPSIPFPSPWKAETKGVAGGTQGIELVLGKGLELAGRVTDERGAPIRGATVVLQPKEEEAWTFDNVVIAATDRDGAFTTKGLQQGAWRAEVSSDGYVSVQNLEVEIPAFAPLVVALGQGASVTGLVLDEQDAPVPVATVRVARDQGPGAFDRCDDHGAFQLKGLAGGRLTLSARAEDFADSEALELELAAAEARRDVVLRLRRAGRIAGEVLDVGGEPLGGAQVTAGGKPSSRCGLDGHFEIGGLLPGEVQVTASNGDTGLRLSAQVTVVAGETAHVRLQKPESLVHMHGIVRVAGDPGAGANIHSQERETKQPGPWCRSAEDGSYALELPRPGAYWIGVGPAEGSTYSWLAVDVPRCSDFAQDLELSLGRVSGRVRAQNGSPISGVRVEAKQTSDKTSASGWGRVTTNERGEYELVLPAATYELAAGGDGGDADPARSFARTALAEIVVVNRSHLRGIDFELAEGGTIEGVVRWGDGSPGADAQLWIGPQGKSVESTSLVKADARGRFRVEGVGAGKAVVTATLGLGTAEWQKLEVKPGSVQTVELTLAASTALEVRVLDRGTPVAAEVTAVDEKGKGYGSVTEAGPIARIGPLPAGRYRVTAHLGERTASAEVTLTGKQESSKLDIMLP